MRLRTLAALAFTIGGSVLAAPHRTAAAAFAQTAASDLVVDRAGDVFFVRATINGVGPFWLLLDTGAPITMLDVSVLNRLGKSPGPIESWFLVLGSRTPPLSAPSVTDLRIEVPGLPTLTGRQWPLVDYSDERQRRSRAFDGVLGADALDGVTTVVDFPGNRVHVIRPAATPAARAGRTAVFTATMNFLVYDLRYKARTVIATGGDEAVMLTSPLAREFIGRTPPPDFRGFSIGGASWTFAQQPATLSRETTGPHASRDFDAIIGAKFLRDFVVTLDGVARAVTLVPTGPGRRTD